MKPSLYDFQFTAFVEDLDALVEKNALHFHEPKAAKVPAPDDLESRTHAGALANGLCFTGRQAVGMNALDLMGLILHDVHFTEYGYQGNPQVTATLEVTEDGMRHYRNENGTVASKIEAAMLNALQFLPGVRVIEHSCGRHGGDEGDTHRLVAKLLRGVHVPPERVERVAEGPEFGEEDRDFLALVRSCM